MYIYRKAIGMAPHRQIQTLLSYIFFVAVYMSNESLSQKGVFI